MIELVNITVEGGEVFQFGKRELVDVVQERMKGGLQLLRGRPLEVASNGCLLIYRENGELCACRILSVKQVPNAASPESIGTHLL